MSGIPPTFSRRHLIAGLGAVAASTAIPAIAAQTTGESPAQPLADPRTKYPRPLN